MNSDVFSQVSKLGFNVSREWLEACVDFCREQDPSVSVQNLVKAVCDQWMETDITNEGIQATPQIKTDLLPGSAKGPILQGKFCVQVQSALDVGQNSAYSQLQTALKVRNENTLVSADVDTQRPLTAAWEPKSKRMLKLNVSDGFKNYPALEFEPISQLSYPVTPGLKLELCGPIQVRRGVLLLKATNVKVLGGHVTELEERCSLVQQLKQVLGHDNVDAAPNATGNHQIGQNATGNHQIGQNATGNRQLGLNATGNHQIGQSGTVNQRPVQSSSVASWNDPFYGDDDEMFNAIEDPPPVVNSFRLANVKKSSSQMIQTTRKVPMLAPTQPQGPRASTSTASQKSTKKPPAKKTKPPAPKKEPKPRKAPTKQKQPPKAAPSEAASIWGDEDDDETLLLCAEVVDPCKNPTQKRVPKIPSFPPIWQQPKKGKFEPVTSEQEEDPFPDEDDALFCSIDSPQIKKEALAIESQKNLKFVPKIEPMSQISQRFHSSLPMDYQASALKNSPEFSSQTTLTQSNPSFKPYNYFVNVDKTSDAIEIIKGCIVSLASKLTVKEEASGRVWSVKVIVTDGLETLAASLSPSMVADAFGFSPKDYSKMELSDKKHAMKEATSKLASKLVNFNGLLKMSFRATNPEPEIIELTAMNRGHLQQLKNRIARDNY